MKILRLISLAGLCVVLTLMTLAPGAFVLSGEQDLIVDHQSTAGEADAVTSDIGEALEHGHAHCQHKSTTDTTPYLLTDGPFGRREIAWRLRNSGPSGACESQAPQRPPSHI